MDIATFRNTVWDNFHTMRRQLPWREPELDGTFDVYKILISEVMLQQTQATRVIPKYQQFVEVFPDIHTVAQATLADVLIVWNGLGYNRRAKYLHEAAKQLSSKRHPWSYADLVACKGIGTNTAAAIMVYAYSEPLVFVETNIRTVFIHCFFKDQREVHDRELLPLVATAIPGLKGKEQPAQKPRFLPGAMRKTAGLSHYGPREWYWALMDYGVYLKATVGNASQSSKHYTKQLTFEGSIRQIRGQVLRQLAAGSLRLDDLAQAIPDKRLTAVLDDLQRDGLISLYNDRFSLG